MEEGIKKGWQLEEVKQMLFGKRSERYISYSSDITSGTQTALGAVFDSEDVEAVIAATRARAANAALAQKQLRKNQSSP